MTMKKYFIQGMLALAATLMLTGCHEEDVFSGSTLDQKAKAYEETFVEAFGMPNKNHTWGFGTVGNARTRTELKKDSWDDDEDNAELVAIMKNEPPKISDGERAYVKTWFENNPGFTAGVDIHNFYVQHVYGQANKPYNIINDSGSNRVENGTMDFLEFGDGTIYDHISDFNANMGGTWNIVYVKNGSALDVRYKCSWSNETQSGRFKLAHITGTAEDGTAVDGYYIGLAMYGHKYDNGNLYMNGDKEEYCDDWILKIIPGKGEKIVIQEDKKQKVTVVYPDFQETIITETTTEKYKTKQLLQQGRVLCEDLGSSGHVDIDFNDLVFDAKIWRKANCTKTTQKITHIEEGEETKVEEPEPTIVEAINYENEISVVAAGGTLPLAFAGKGDLNALFGVDSYLYMINTVTDQELAPGSKVTTADPKSFKLEGPNAYRAISEIPIWVEFGKETKQLNQVIHDEAQGATGYIPRCLLVPLGTPWATERTPIDEAYANFPNYVQHMQPCWNYAAPSAIYPGSSSMGLTAESKEAFNVVKYDSLAPIYDSKTEYGKQIYLTKEIEVDQVAPEMEGTPVQVYTGPLLQYYEDTRIKGDNANDAIYISGNQFSRMSAGDRIRIYGIGANGVEGFESWLFIGLAQNNLTGFNSVESRSSLASNGYIEVSVDPAVLKSSGLYIAGSNFVLTGVTYVTPKSDE